MSFDRDTIILVTVRAVSADVSLVRADGAHSQQYLLNEKVMGSLTGNVMPGDVLELQLSEVPERPSKILRVRRT